MKKFFYVGLVGLGLFEVMNVYFIMPMPGSQQMNTIDLAYFLYSYRWYFRIFFGLLIALGGHSAFTSSKPWVYLPAILALVGIIYMFNFKMTADRMFLQPQSLDFVSYGESTLSDSSLVIAISHHHEAKAYPIRYIQYHHQVRDTIAGKPIMITYCNVCRKGRVFEPMVGGKEEAFRLVGMDHFNAMFEDKSTKSWWRQVNGEAITGPLKGQILPEMESNQYTLSRFFALHPHGKVMKEDELAMDKYDTLGRYEKGHSKGKLTRTDTASWQNKSWVVGVEVGSLSKAYDWNDLRKRRVIHDQIGSTHIVLALASDDHSFVVLERNADDVFIIRGDSLVSMTDRFDFAGRSANGSQAKMVKGYQEFWHSWKQFHPETDVYQGQAKM